MVKTCTTRSITRGVAAFSLMIATAACSHANDGGAAVDAAAAVDALAPVDAGDAAPTCVPWSATGNANGCTEYDFDAGPQCAAPCADLYEEPPDGSSSCTVSCSALGCCAAPYPLAAVLDDGTFMCVRRGATLSGMPAPSDVHCTNCGGYDCPADVPYCSVDCSCFGGAMGAHCTECGGYDCMPPYLYCSADCSCVASPELEAVLSGQPEPAKMYCGPTCTNGQNCGAGGCSRCHM
jgi:hypothetical protein